MRSHNNLYQEVISFQNLLAAAKLAQRGKRFKAATSRFNFFLEKELWLLHRQLAQKKYQPSSYRHFLIFEPKKRLISAAPYKDRVVHHALHNVLEPIFDATFISDSYATRKNKGTHAALNRFQEFSKKCRYVLKCDIKQYFPSINHSVLLNLLKRKIACRDTLWLIQTILASSLKSNPIQSNPIQSNPQNVSIPIGNLTSQFFANVYLNGFDHFIKEQLKCRYYLRYMDDFVIFHQDKNFLWKVKQQIQEHLRMLHLELHENKCRIFQTQYGVPFLGFIMAPEWRRLKKSNVTRFKRRLKHLQKLYQAGEIEWQSVHQSANAWIGHAKHGNTKQLREDIFSEHIFQREG